MGKLLYSKRNKVEDWGFFIVKTVKSHLAAKDEANRLKTLKSKGVYVPNVYLVKGNKIILQKIEGVPLVEVLEQKKFSKLEVQSLAESLAHWFWSFYEGVEHEKTGLISEDVNCRNFLYTPNKTICGVDFEGFSIGKKEQNIGEVLSFIENYSLPPYTIKLFYDAFLSQALNQLKVNENKILEFKKQAEAQLISRRKAKKSYSSK